ncbi:MAG: M50 family metallopeptidase [Pirellulales bacterium]|nr:M50 family metallopeptidase [Pirellulales bacterium]
MTHRPHPAAGINHRLDQESNALLLQEPPPTPYDLKFSLFGIPVRISPYFWLAGIVLGASARKFEFVVLWVVAALLAILVHELGHAFAARRFGNRPSIVLHAAGGLAIYSPRRETLGTRLAILAAGPGAGFLLAAVIIVLLKVSRRGIFFEFPGDLIELDGGQPLNFRLNVLTADVLYICIYWGLVNLLPIYPLDGGQIARLLSVRHDPILGESRASMLSLWTAGGAALFCAFKFPDSLFLPLFFGFLAYENYRALQSGSRWR